jgi:hypothetical protein
LPGKLFGNGLRKSLGFTRVLEHERALKIALAVQAARENEMAFEQRARAPESSNHLFCLHRSTPDGFTRRDAWHVTMPRG